MPDVRPRRDFRITRALLERLGFTPDCPGCDALRRRGGQQSHSRECRDRVEAEMQRVPVLAQRLYALDVRHGLATEESHEQPADEAQPDAEAARGRGDEQPAEARESIYSPTPPADTVQGSADDHGDPGLPRGVGRPREHEPNNRDVRQRQEEPRGVVRPREPGGDDPEEDRPAMCQRLGAVEKCQTDVIEIHNDYLSMA